MIVAQFLFQHKLSAFWSKKEMWTSQATNARCNRQSLSQVSETPSSKLWVQINLSSLQLCLSCIWSQKQEKQSQQFLINGFAVRTKLKYWGGCSCFLVRVAASPILAITNDIWKFFWINLFLVLGTTGLCTKKESYIIVTFTHIFLSWNLLFFSSFL